MIDIIRAAIPFFVLYAVLRRRALAAAAGATALAVGAGLLVYFVVVRDSMNVSKRHDMSFSVAAAVGVSPKFGGLMAGMPPIFGRRLSQTSALPSPSGCVTCTSRSGRFFGSLGS